MGNVNARWAAWAAAYLTATAAAIFCVVKLAAAFDDAVSIGEARGALVDELRGQLGPIDLTAAQAPGVDEHQDQTGPTRSPVAQDGPGD